MRAHLLNLPAIARASGFALVAVALVATAIHLGRHEAAPRQARTAVTRQIDPPMDEIIRCEALGMVAEHDAWCEAAWAENRRRFFTYRPADSGSRNAQTRNQAESEPEGR